MSTVESERYGGYMEISNEELIQVLFDVQSNDLVLEMRDMKYAKYLKTEYWRNVRQAMYDKVGCRCEICGVDKDIHVHHLHYANIGEETLNDLICLCGKCHRAIHYADNPVVVVIGGRLEFYNQIKLANEIKKKFSNKKYLKVLPLAQRELWTMPQMQLLLECCSQDILKMFCEEIKNGLLVKSTGICEGEIHEYYLINQLVWYMVTLDFPNVVE